MYETVLPVCLPAAFSWDGWCCSCMLYLPRYLSKWVIRYLDSGAVTWGPAGDLMML